jgi:hypothetical protein
MWPCVEIQPWQEAILDRLLDARARGVELRVVLHPRTGNLVVVEREAQHER